MPPQNKITTRNFHIVGGGCFGSGYARWLLRSVKLGWLDFKKIFVIDHNPECAAKNLNLPEAQVTLVQKDWVEYFTDYLLRNYQNQAAQQDHWVPSPLSPHILFLGMKRALETLLGESLWQEEEFREEVSPPVKIPLKSGDLAVSFAKWKCPVHCIEPSTCPAIHEQRDWEMKTALEEDFGRLNRERNSQEHFISAHVLKCSHLVHGVGTIPCWEIFSAFQKLIQDAQTQACQEMIVATMSGCHGLVSKARLVGANPWVRPVI